MSIITVKQLVKLEIDKLIIQAKLSLNEVKTVALAQAWRILQLAVASTIQVIENTALDLTGKDKKTIAMELLSEFYDKVFIIIDIPFVPNLVERIIHKYTKVFLMILVSSTIDAMVTTFRNTGVFVDRSIDTNAFMEVRPKISEK
jgi:hypothetical protein